MCSTFKRIHSYSHIYGVYTQFQLRCSNIIRLVSCIFPFVSVFTENQCATINTKFITQRSVCDNTRRRRWPVHHYWHSTVAETGIMSIAKICFVAIINAKVCNFLKFKCWFDWLIIHYVNFILYTEKEPIYDMQLRWWPIWAWRTFKWSQRMERINIKWNRTLMFWVVLKVSTFILPVAILYI